MTDTERLNWLEERYSGVDFGYPRDGEETRPVMLIDLPNRCTVVAGLRATIDLNASPPKTPAVSPVESGIGE